jgi:hypothetical protein
VKADKLTQALEIILNHLDKKLTKESNATI